MVDKISDQTTERGFTLVELLIVIVVVSILVAISVVSYQGVQKKTRDSIRANDLASIEKSLRMYHSRNGSVPRTSSYGGFTGGGWDRSSGPNWLSFLGNNNGPIPVDPINDSPVDDTRGPLGSGYAYYYYCYNPGGGLMSETYNVRLTYKSEQTGQLVNRAFAVKNCS